MIECVRRIQFCAGHRVLGHESKCANPHGHNYIAYFHAQSKELDEIGRVIDFSVLKELIGGWIEKYWDHKFILFDADNELKNRLDPDFPIYLMPSNPTAENMAIFLLEIVCPSLLKTLPITVSKVVIWETENCFAEVSLENLPY